MPSSLEIQVTREICTTVTASSSNSMPGQQSSMEEIRSTIAAGPAPSFPPLAHCRRSSVPIIPPPAYENDVQSSLHADALDSDDSEIPPPPDYSKFVEITRAERCFYYGFLFFPIWFFGFLHFWPSFSRTPMTLPTKDAELPSWIDSTTGLPMYSTPQPSPLPSSPSQKTFSWRRTSSTPARQSCTTLMMNRPDAYSAWRKEERAWALRCGYAMATTWAIIMMFLFVCIQTGVFGFSFN